MVVFAIVLFLLQMVYCHSIIWQKYLQSVEETWKTYHWNRYSDQIYFGSLLQISGFELKVYFKHICPHNFVLLYLSSFVVILFDQLVYGLSLSVCVCSNSKHLVYKTIKYFSKYFLVWYVWTFSISDIWFSVI